MQPSNATTASTSGDGSDNDISRYASATRVLTNPELWRSITALMSGWPLFIKHMYQTNVALEFTGGTQRERWNPFVQRAQSGVLVHLAIFGNDMHALAMIYEIYEAAPPRPGKHSPLSFAQALACAVHVGNLEMLKWLHARQSSHPDWKWGKDVLKDALVHENLELLDYVHEHCPRECLTINLVEHDSVKVIAWLHQHGYSLSSSVMRRAAQSGNLGIVQYIHENVSASGYPSTMDHAAKHGQFEVVRYLHYADAQCTTQTMDYAARAGRLDIVQLLHEQRTEGCTVAAMNGAASHGRLDVVRFLHEHRSEGCTTAAMERAAWNGHLDVVMFLHKHRSEGCTTRAIDKAAERGHLDIVEFLFANRREGCSAEALFWAMHGGHHRVLRFLCERRPDLCSDELLEDAAIGRSGKALRVLCKFSSKGCLFDARVRARKWGREALESILTAFISPEVESCSLAQHGRDDPRRRCQASAILDPIVI